MAFEETQKKLANLPNWAKIGLIGIAAILTYLIIKHRSTSTASTGITDATGAAGGIYNVEIPPSGVLGGTSGGGGSSTTTVPTIPPDTTTPPTPAPIVSGGSPPRVPVSPEGPWTGTIPANKIQPAPLSPMRNYHTGFGALPINVQPPETFSQVYESVGHGLAAQPANQGISGTNTTPPYQR